MLDHYYMWNFISAYIFYFVSEIMNSLLNKHGKNTCVVLFWWHERLKIKHHHTILLTFYKLLVECFSDNPESI